MRGEYEDVAVPAEVSLDDNLRRVIQELIEANERLDRIEGKINSIQNRIG